MPSRRCNCILRKVKIEKSKLKSIYSLCEQNPRSPLSPRVFGVLFHFVHAVHSRQWELPSTLPSSLALILRSNSPKKVQRNSPIATDVNTVPQSVGSPFGSSTNVETQSPSKSSSPQRKTRGKFVFDEKSQLWYNPGTKLYFNENTKLYSKHPQGPLFYVYDQKQKKLTVVNAGNK